MAWARIVLVGFGSVGRALARLLAYKGGFLRERFDVDICVVGVVDSRGMVFREDGFSGSDLLKLSSVPRGSVFQFSPYGVEGVDLELLYDKVNPDVHIELTPSNYETGAPSFENIMLALGRGAHVVTASKAPLVLAFDDIMGRARSKGLRVRFKATVMGGSPFLEILWGMKSHDVIGVEGILNATTNYILTLMEDELLEFDEALRRAQAIGVAEADPGLDVDGVDAAAKLVIISNVIGKPVRLGDVKRVSLANVKLRDILHALKEGYTIKHMARFNVERGEAIVEPVRVRKDDIMAHARGTMNAARIRSDVGDYTFIGWGGGGSETAHTVLDDVISLAFEVGARG